MLFVAGRLAFGAPACLHQSSILVWAYIFRVLVLHVEGLRLEVYHHFLGRLLLLSQWRKLFHDGRRLLLSKSDIGGTDAIRRRLSDRAISCWLHSGEIFDLISVGGRNLDSLLLRGELAHKVLLLLSEGSFAAHCLQLVNAHIAALLINGRNWLSTWRVKAFLMRQAIDEVIPWEKAVSVCADLVLRARQEGTARDLVQLLRCHLGCLSFLLCLLPLVRGRALWADYLQFGRLLLFGSELIAISLAGLLLLRHRCINLQVLLWRAPCKNDLKVEFVCKILERIKTDQSQ